MTKGRLEWPGSARTTTFYPNRDLLYKKWFGQKSIEPAISSTFFAEPVIFDIEPVISNLLKTEPVIFSFFWAEPVFFSESESKMNISLK